MKFILNLFSSQIATSLAFLLLFCVGEFAFGETSACSQSLSLYPIFTSPKPESSLRDQEIPKGVAIFLNLLELMLEEISNSQAASFEPRMRLLTDVIQSPTPIQNFEDNLATPSHLLTLLRTSTALKKITAILSSQDWDQIRSHAIQKKMQLERIAVIHEEESNSSDSDFLDLPDANGQVRLHRFLQNRQYDLAIALLENPKTTTRYVNTRDKNGLTPADFFEERSVFWENLTIRFAFGHLFGGEVAARVAEMLKVKSAMDGLEMKNLEAFFFINPLNRPNANHTGPTPDIETRADQAAANLDWFYEIGGNLDVASETGDRLADIFTITGHREGLKQLKSLGANLVFQNRKGKTLIHRAATNDQWKIVSYLVEIGLDINAPDHHGMTPIFNVLNDLDAHTAIKIFADLGANLNHASTEEGITPAHLYSRIGLTESLRALALNGADLELKDKAGMTPLDRSKKNKRATLAAFAEYFISKGIDPESRGIYKTDSNPPTYLKKGDSEE